MIAGTVTADGVPIIVLTVAGQAWQSVIDTGFNSDLELPSALRPAVNARYRGRIHSLLASGQSVVEDVYYVDFPFEGQIVHAEATFAAGIEILIGTHLIRHYRLVIDFPNQTLDLTRTVP